MNSNDLNEIKLLNKKDFLTDKIKPEYKEKFKGWKIKQLRDHFELTHKKHECICTEVLFYISNAFIRKFIF